MEHCPLFSKQNIKKFVVLIVGICLFYIRSPLAHAASDTSFAIANYYPIVDRSVEEGDIISFSPKGYFKSKITYDSLIVGVVTDHPAIALQLKGQQTSYPVVATGNSIVKVTTGNGAIKKGDLITTSTTPGVGMKATISGYVIGAATEDFTSTNPKTVGKILVTINIHYNITNASVRVGLLDVLNLSALATYEEPIRALRYFLAAILILGSLLVGFFLFARVANKGLEALGRNPLAARTIQFGIILNVILTIATVFAGLLVAYLVLRL